MNDQAGEQMSAISEIFAADKMIQLLGATLLHGEAGHVVIGMQVTEKMVQRHNTCQGGAIFTLADAAFGIAANSKGQSAVSQQCSINFLRPAPLGEMLRAEALARSRVGRTEIYDVTVSGDSVGLVAEFRGIARILGSD